MELIKWKGIAFEKTAYWNTTVNGLLSRKTELTDLFLLLAQHHLAGEMNEAMNLLRAIVYMISFSCGRS